MFTPNHLDLECYVNLYKSAFGIKPRNPAVWATEAEFELDFDQVAKASAAEAEAEAEEVREMANLVAEVAHDHGISAADAARWLAQA